MIIKRFIKGRCFICYQSLRLANHGICSFCVTSLPVILSSCQYCALPVSNPTNGCYRCQAAPPPWQRLIAVSAYQEPLKWLIHRMKFNNHTHLGNALSRLLLLRWLLERRERFLNKPQLILPVPLHRSRQWRRGFNQSALLAKSLADWLSVEYSDTTLVRTRKHIDQKCLPAQLRRSNVDQAFTCRRNIKGRRILIVDDIVTTGSTIYEISNLLQQHNPQEIQVICLCRTL